MQFFDSLASTLSLFDKKKSDFFVFGAVVFAFLACGGFVGFLYYTKGQQVAELKVLYEQIKKNDAIIAKHEQIVAEQERIEALLEEHKGFSIKTFFEQLCQEHKFTPETGWETETRSVTGNETFDEVLLNATFKNQTMQKLITFIQALENTEIVYIKEVDIKKEGQKSITFSVRIATKKRKQFWDN